MKSLHKILLIALLCAASTSFSQRHYQAAKAIVAPQIDGLGNDACWSGSNWHAVDQLWLGVQPSADDFSERFKVCWDANKLYVLAEVTDDSLGDNYANPLVNYWEDDTWEVFIDEAEDEVQLFKHATSPSQLSAKTIEQQRADHLPFRSWCKL